MEGPAVPNIQSAVRYAIGKTIDEDHPRIDTGHCLDVKKRTDPCGICEEICPTGATVGCRTHEWNTCIDCNLCVSACPTRALRPSADTIDKFLRGIESDAAEITLNCEQHEAEGYIKTYCLGGIPWEVLALCALDKRVMLNTSMCTDCPETAGKAQFIAALRKTREFLGKKFFEERIRFTESTPDSGFSRRETLDMMRGVGKNLTNNMLNRAEGSRVDGLFFRRMLADRMADRKEGDPTYTLHTITFNDSCWACNLCKNICPEKAISIEHDKEDGEYAVVHAPWLCVTCGLCKAVCADDAIEGFISFKTDDPIVPLATDAHPQVCEVCGGNYRPDGTTTCARCIAKEERRIAKEERKRKNRERAAQAKAEREAKAAAKKAEEERLAKEAAGEATAKTDAAGVVDPVKRGMEIEAEHIAREQAAGQANLQA